MLRKKIAIRIRHIIVVLLGISLIIGAGVAALGPQLQVPLVFVIAFIAIVKIFLGYSWDEVESDLVLGLTKIAKVFYLFIGIGMLMGIWVASGSVPTVVYYGLQVISPAVYLITAYLIMSVISYAIGSSVGATGTVGIALMMVGEALSIPGGLAAGAIISGAYFGDRTSPLASTLNVTAAAAGVPQHSLVKDLLRGIMPAWLLTAVIYGIMGWRYQSIVQTSYVPELLLQLAEQINISPLLFAAPVLLLVLAFYRVPLLVNLFINMVFSSLLGIYFQGLSLEKTMVIMYKGYSSQTGIKLLDNLLNRGGIAAIMDMTILCLLIAAMAGLLEGGGFLTPLINSFHRSMQRSRIYLYSMLTSIAGNILSGSQVLAIILTSTIFNGIYDKNHINRLLLARSIADGGTILAPLIPWNMNGLFMTGLLGISAFSYAPYTFLCWLTPLVSLSNYFILRKKQKLGAGQNI